MRYVAGMSTPETCPTPCIRDSLAAGMLVARQPLRGPTEYLMVQTRKGCGLPFGKVNPGEDIRAAAVRETLEETGILVRSAIVLYGAECEGRWATTFLAAAYDGELRASDEGKPMWSSPIRLLDRSARFPAYNKAVLLAALERRMALNFELRALGRPGELDTDRASRWLDSYRVPGSDPGVSELADLPAAPLAWVLRHYGWSSDGGEEFVRRDGNAARWSRLPAPGPVPPGGDDTALRARRTRAARVAALIDAAGGSAHSARILLAEVLAAVPLCREEEETTQ